MREEDLKMVWSLIILAGVLLSFLGLLVLIVIAYHIIRISLLVIREIVRFAYDEFQRTSEEVR